MKQLLSFYLTFFVFIRIIAILVNYYYNSFLKNSLENQDQNVNLL